MSKKIAYGSMDSKHKIQNVFESLSMRFHDKGTFYAANEFSDVWYFLVPQDQGEWILKTGIGECHSDVVFADRRISRERKWAMIGLGMLLFVMMVPVFWFFIYSLYWVGALLAVIFGLMIPRYSVLKAKLQIIPRLRRAGIEARFAGVVYLLPADFEPGGGLNSVPLRSTP